MATKRKYTKKQKKEAERIVRSYWRPILIILICVVITFTILYFTGTLDRLIDMYFKPAPPDTDIEDPSGDDAGGDDTGSGGGNLDNDSSLYKNVTTTVSSLEDLKVNFIDVGQGDCIIIELPDGKNMIIDSGEKRNDNKTAITEFTTANNIESFDYLLLTHQDSDHAGNMSWVIDNYDIKYIFRPNNYSNNKISSELPDTFNYGDGYASTTQIYANFMVSAYNENCPVEVFNKNSDFTNTIICGDDTYTYKFDFLTPTLDTISYGDPNNYSPIMLLEYSGKRILFTGDAELENLGEYVSVYGDMYNVDVLKVGHHGSNNATTSAFIEAVDPEYAIIQCGTNNKYGHPHKETLDILSAYDSEMIVYRTDNNGNIILTINALGIEFTMEEADTSNNFTPGVKVEKTGIWHIDIIFDKKEFAVA